MVDIYDRMAQLLKQNKATKVFDVGAGTGELGFRLMKSGACIQYKGLDRNPEAIKILHKRGLNGEEGDLRWYDGMKFFWDTVVMADVIEEMGSLALVKDAVLRARRMFVLSTQVPLYDSLYRPQNQICYNIDEVLTITRNCSFYLQHFETLGSHSILVFARRFKGAKKR